MHPEAGLQAISQLDRRQGIHAELEKPVLQIDGFRGTRVPELSRPENGHEPGGFPGACAGPPPYTPGETRAASGLTQLLSV